MAKFFRRLLITLVILTALVAIGDRVLAAVAEARIADRVAATAADYGAYSDRRPEVTVHGWPFVTQAVEGEFSQIDVVLSDVGAEGLTIPELTMVAREVDTSELLDGGSVVAATVDVTGRIPAAAVEELMREATGHDFTLHEDGTGTVTTSVEAAGLEVEITGTGVIDLDGDSVAFVPEVVEALVDDLPEQVDERVDEYVEEVRRRLSTEVALPELPWGLRLTEIDFDDGAIEVAGSAEDVPLT